METIVLVGGLGSNKNIWKPQEPLKKHFNIIELELLGHGSNYNNKEITLNNMVDDLKEQIDEKWIKKVHLLGSSLGGVVIQGFTKKYRDMVKSLVLCNTMSHLPAWMSILNAFSDIHNISHLSHDELIEREVERCVYNKADKRIKELLYNSFTLRTDTHAKNARVAENVNYLSLLSELRREALPTMIITGKHDNLVPPWFFAREQKLFLQCEYVKFQNSGHLPNIEEPELFNSVLKDFYEKVIDKNK